MVEVHHLEDSTEADRQTSIDKTKRELWQFVPKSENLQSGVIHKTSYQNQQSVKSKQLLTDILRVSARPYSILITGETGTGKTFAARQIHQNSARAKLPFMELNCANLSENLVEAELFGYRKGAFTGADRDHKGLFEEATGGVLFLDEIGDLSPAVQNKLLKAIDEKKIKRLGSNQYIECDVQIISATSRNLTEMVRGKEFREDLYCRLAVLTIEVPPLRERRKDIPGLINYYLREAAQTIVGSTTQDAIFKIERGAVELLSEYDYPGNIRVLKNLIYELTSYVSLDEPISVELVQTALGKLCAPQALSKKSSAEQQVVEAQESLQQEVPHETNRATKNSGVIYSDKHPTSLQAIVGEGDIVLPVEVCIIRRGETLKEWTTRAKKYSIEAARESSDGVLETAAERLGLTVSSLKCRLHRTESTRRRRSKQ